MSYLLGNITFKTKNTKGRERSINIERTNSLVVLLYITSKTWFTFVLSY